ncbi:MAG: GNAT family N-acetyltransferase [Sphingomonadaceae bacterium]
MLRYAQHDRRRVARRGPRDARHDGLGGFETARRARKHLTVATNSTTIASIRYDATGEIGTIETLLPPPPEPKAPYILRPHRPGDMGWVVHRHGVLYFQEYGYDERFEALVASIVAEFIQNFDPTAERCWIAERDGQAVGSIFLVRKTDTVAKLRLFLVEPEARGLGIGTRLVDECVRFARATGYRQIVLWTQSELIAARRIYERAGFRKTAEEPHQSWGRDLVAETWQLEL